MQATEPYAVPAPVLELDQACVAGEGRLILDHVSLRIEEGQHTAILGANGSGKSTLVKLVARQLYPLARDDGANSVRVFGRARWHVSQLRSLLGMVSPATQLDYTTDTPLEVFDAVVSGFFAARGLGLDHQVTHAMRERAHEALELMGAGRLIGRSMASLSTGEARRVLIARALVHRPRALLLDEPTAGLDIATRRRFLETLRHLAQHGTTLLLVTHHIDEIIPEIDHVVLLRDGKVMRRGTKADVLSSGVMSEAFDMPLEVRQRGEFFDAAPL
ncbi:MULTISPECIES: ABC transporter ATP-binding protein [Dyella]|uniref:ATP-binding cassette domain-containing protein n=2 Tax=Dyella TaxID=231454 RepID=A0A4R0YD81_9GAMM|nr:MULTISPECIES: ATP-binding cassette domain-containing protein [Dyella]TBR36309.1 ATP-binding cassette domain-containing protein [Dyella terrae]TCI05966.1 ATP-binding cassette domain-containing protein [Dyella soli]